VCVCVCVQSANSNCRTFGTSGTTATVLTILVWCILDTMMAIACSLSSVFLWAVLCWSCGSVHGLAQSLVTSGKPKCFSAEVPKDQMIKIHYTAADIDLNKDSRKYSPSYITLLEKPIVTLEERMLEEADESEKIDRIRSAIGHARKPKPRPVSQEITDVRGSFLHQVHAGDAVVEVCIRASKASQIAPMMFHIRIEEVEEDVLDEFEQLKADEENKVPLLGAEHHFSFMETQLDRIEHEMHTIIKEADFFRERDALYHKQADDLNKATLFWPILHCFILVVTGFTQANHIISFFKQRRII